MPDGASLSASIELRHVSKHYGISKEQRVPAADYVSLAVQPGGGGDRVDYVRRLQPGGPTT